MAHHILLLSTQTNLLVPLYCTLHAIMYMVGRALTKPLHLSLLLITVVAIQEGRKTFSLSLLFCTVHVHAKHT